VLGDASCFHTSEDAKRICSGMMEKRIILKEIEVRIIIHNCKTSVFNLIFVCRNKVLVGSVGVFRLQTAIVWETSVRRPSRLGKKITAAECAVCCLRVSVLK
jgi:hypothetical protein